MLDMEMDGIGMSARISSDDIVLADNLDSWDLSFAISDKSSPSTLFRPSKPPSTEATNISSSESPASAATGESNQQVQKIDRLYTESGIHWNRNHADEQLELWYEQLIILSNRIHRSARSIASHDSPSLTVNSPQVEGLFEVTRTLITTMESLAHYYASQSTKRPDGLLTNSSSRESLSTPDRSVVFLTLACEQKLLGVFEAVCVSIERHVHPEGGGELNPLSSQSATAPTHLQSSRTGPSSPLGTWKSPSTSEASGPAMAQFAMILQLLSHLLSRLDRALQPLTDDASSQKKQVPPFDSSSKDHPLTGKSLELIDGSWEQFQEAENNLQTFATTSMEGPAPGVPIGNSHSMLDVAKEHIDGVKVQHVRLRRRIEGLQKRVEQSNSL
jgi:hypothetical protein